MRKTFLYAWFSGQFLVRSLDFIKIKKVVSRETTFLIHKASLLKGDEERL
jgi:hypothetical protein